MCEGQVNCSGNEVGLRGSLRIVLYDVITMYSVCCVSKMMNASTWFRMDLCILRAKPRRNFLIYYPFLGAQVDQGCGYRVDVHRPNGCSTVFLHVG